MGIGCLKLECAVKYVDRYPLEAIAKQLAQGMLFEGFTLKMCIPVSPVSPLF